MRNKTEQEQEFLRDAKRLQSIIRNATVFRNESINVANAYEKVVEFFRLVQSIATKKVCATLPLKGWKVWIIKSRARIRAEQSKKLFTGSAYEVLSSEHNHATTEISSDTLFFGEPKLSITECKRQTNPKFQEKIRLEIVEFVESFDKKFPLDWIRE